MKALVLAVLVLSGCYFKTRETLVESPVSTAQVSTAIVAAPAPDVTAVTRANVLALRVETKRQCTTESTQDFEVVRTKRIVPTMSAWSLPIIAVGIAVPAVFLLVPAATGLVAAARASDHRHESYTESRVLSHNTYACPLRPSGEHVQVRFPSGATFEAQTDDNGRAEVTIPDAELDHGSARVELANGGRTVDYDRRSYDREQLAVTADE